MLSLLKAALLSCIAIVITSNGAHGDLTKRSEPNRTFNRGSPGYQDAQRALERWIRRGLHEEGIFVLPGDSIREAIVEIRQARRSTMREAIPFIRRRWRNIGVATSVIPPDFEPFLIDGEFPPEEPIRPEEINLVPATHRERLELERSNQADPYHLYELRYAQRITGSSMGMNSWGRLLANRDPRALRIRRDFLNRARWILKEVRKIFLTNGVNQSTAREQDEEYAYVLLMFQLFFDDATLSSRREYCERLAQFDPDCTEARVLFRRVYTTPWPTLEDPRSSSDEEV